MTRWEVSAPGKEANMKFKDMDKKIVRGIYIMNRGERELIHLGGQNNTYFSFEEELGQGWIVTETDGKETGRYNVQFLSEIDWA